MTCPALEDDAGAQYIEEGLLPVLHTLKSKLVLHTLKSERALDPGIKKPSRGRHAWRKNPGCLLSHRFARAAEENKRSNFLFM